jgi:hypothetical protein
VGGQYLFLSVWLSVYLSILNDDDEDNDEDDHQKVRDRCYLCLMSFKKKRTREKRKQKIYYSSFTAKDGKQ